ncbi:MAG: hypothetical protein P4M12_04640 [Gammaproteobacteria bacterium]|nr:hypothetical protein [Gammaproteobacteria bacterium]
MKIHELLLTTITELNVHLPIGVTPLTTNWNNLFDISEHITLDFQITLRELQYLISQSSHLEATPENLKGFKDFLANRWEYVRKTDLSYPHRMNINTNIICWLLANDIASVLSSTPYNLLMPSMQHPINEVTLNDWNDLQLHEFILNDDETRFIEVADCIQYAEDDGILKYTSLFPALEQPGLESGIKLLSETEKHRVIFHSPEATAYYVALHNLLEVKNRGMSLGSFVRRLMNQLFAGGVHALNIEDHNAEVGSAAIDGITEFNRFLLTLENDERAIIFNSCAPNLTVGRNFEIIWLRLLSRVAMQGRIALSEERINEIIIILENEGFEDQPCIELLAISLNQILQHNPNLYSIMPRQAQASAVIADEILQDYVNNFAATKKKLELSMKTENVNPKIVYGTAGDLTFIFRMNNRLINYFSKQEILTAIEDDYAETFFKSLDANSFNKLIESNIDFLMIMGRLIRSDRIFLCRLLPKLNLQNVFSNSLELEMIMSKLTISEKEAFILNCPPSHFSTIFSNVSDLISVFNHLDKDYYTVLLDKLEPTCIHKMFTSDGIIRILRFIPDIKYLLNLIGIQHTRTFGKNISSLTSLFAALTCQSQKDFIDFMGRENLRSLIMVPILLKILLRSVDEKLHMYLLADILGKDYFINTIKNLSELIFILMDLKKENRERFLTLIGSDHFTKLILSWDDLNSILMLLTPTAKMQVICHLIKVDSLEKIIDAQSLQLVLIQPKEVFEFIYFTSPKHVANILGSVDDLIKVLSKLTSSQQNEFVNDMLTDATICRLIHNTHVLNYVLNYAAKNVINLIVNRLDIKYLWEIVTTKACFIDLLQHLELSKKKDFIRDGSNENNLSTIINSFSLFQNVLSQVDTVSQHHILTALDAEKINEWIAANNGLVNILKIVNESNHTDFLMRLDSKKMSNLLTGQSFYLALVRFDYLRNDVKIYRGVLAVMLRVYAQLISAGGMLNQMQVLDKAAAETLADVILGIKEKNSLTAYSNQFLRGDLQFLYSRYVQLSARIQMDLQPPARNHNRNRLFAVANAAPPSRLARPAAGLQRV